MSDDRRAQFTSSYQQWSLLKPAAREMRHEPTAAENALWQPIRNRQIGQAKFRRQHTVDCFIVDFVCLESALIIEVDGEIHEQPENRDYDAQRQSILEGLGFRVLRFTNKQVLQSLEKVTQTIADALAAAQENNLD